MQSHSARELSGSTRASSAGQRRYRVPEQELRRFADLGRTSSTLTVLRHARLAERMGLSGTDHKVLELVRDVGTALTAGRIAELAGLSTGAVTGVLDRLERAGFLRRVRGTDDRRKVLVEPVEVDEAQYAPLFQSAVESLAAVLARFSPEERAVIERYSNELLAEQRAEIFGSSEY